MGWESRTYGRYYYHSRRVGGRVVKEYVGRGPAAESIADAAALRRARAALFRRHLEAARAADEALERLAAACNVLKSLALMAAGYRQVHRRWRRKRHGQDDG